MKAKFILIRYIAVVVVVSEPAFAQKPAVENSVFWEVTGNGLSKPSYLFGTFHLMGKLYVDSLPNVMAKFNSAETIVGELLIDSTMAPKIMSASVLKGTTLDKLVTEETYQQAASWLKEVSGYDLKLFNGLNPMTIQIFIMTMAQQKYYPMDPSRDIPMDMYFQQAGKRNGKTVIGLESAEDQIQALYGQFTYERQAEMLAEYVANKEKNYAEMVLMNKYYRSGNLTDLELMMMDQKYSAAEMESLVDNRNKKWMDQLPQLMHEKSTFTAVGALHLSGKNGLVNLLRQKGFRVMPLPLK